MMSLIDFIIGIYLCSLSVASTVQPNFVVVVTDAFDGRVVVDKNYKSIVDLENLSKLQDKGITFRKAYCDSPLCVPSRASLLSGNIT